MEPVKVSVREAPIAGRAKCWGCGKRRRPGAQIEAVRGTHVPFEIVVRYLCRPCIQRAAQLVAQELRQFGKKPRRRRLIGGGPGSRRPL